jgi:hypothetical protein
MGGRKDCAAAYYLRDRVGCSRQETHLMWHYVYAHGYRGCLEHEQAETTCRYGERMSAEAINEERQAGKTSWLCACGEDTMLPRGCDSSRRSVGTYRVQYRWIDQVSGSGTGGRVNTSQTPGSSLAIPSCRPPPNCAI